MATSDTMDKKPEGSKSAAAAEDPIEDLTGNLAQVTLSDRRFADSKKSGTEDGLLFDPASFSEDELDEMLETFVKTSAPSKVKRSDGIGWIRVLSRLKSASHSEEESGNFEDLEADWKKLQKSGRRINFHAVQELAIRHGHLGGIWLVFVDTGEEVDKAWEKIARATVGDELGTHAKVTPCEDTEETKDLYRDSKHVVSVYTADFTDREDVMKVEARLRRLGIRQQLSFKPRVYATLGVYSQNQWELKPTIYTSHWDTRKHAGNIRDSTGSRATYMINTQSSE